jgi:hypothetical protein
MIRHPGIAHVTVLPAAGLKQLHPILSSPFRFSN